MFDKNALQELIAFESSEVNVVSLYLGIDWTQQNRDAIKLTIRNLLKEVDTQYKATTDKIENFLTYEHGWSKPGLALFACVEEDFFRSYSIQVPFRNRIRIRQRPYVKPLVHLMDFYADYGVILADQVGARFFKFNLGELQETDGTMGEGVRKGKTGLGSSVTGMRGGQDNTHEEEVSRNLRQTAEDATNFFNSRHIRRLFVGGHAGTVAQLTEYLPKQLQMCIAGTFNADMNAPDHLIREQSINLLHEVNQKREISLVENLVTAAAKGEQAVTGLADTLEAINQGRVSNLIISDGYRVPGFFEPSSNRLAATNTDEILAGNGWETTSDVVERAVTQTIAYGGQVEVISDNQQLEIAGRIGALLRY